MERVLLISVLSLVASILFSQKINEIHYDNIGGDMNEFMEVLLPIGATPGDFTMTLYNGNGGGTLSSHGLETFTIGATDANGTYYSKFISGIQNGAPDGMALDQNGTLIEFLSYEGTFTATEGPANGTNSTDIGVAESDDTTPNTHSLQRDEDDSWFGPSGATPGGPNVLPMPVSLTSFSVKPINTEEIQLNWSTESEENNQYFSIEHSADGRDFIELEQVAGAGTTFEAQHYEFMHKDAKIGSNYYRLRQVDFDGTFSFSDIEVVVLEGHNEISVQPTLAQQEIVVGFSEKSNSDGIVEVVNWLGQVVLIKQVSNKSDKIALSVSGLYKGHYIVRVYAEGGIKSSRFIKL